MGRFAALLGLIAWIGGVAGTAHTASPDEVVAAEREFADDARKRGWVAAFKTYAAADAIVFQPGPVNAQASLAAQPNEPADTTLVWWPVWAGIARSGDLGFTTGPYSVNGRVFGHYFTVWAKQADGTWRWIFDGGPRNAAPSLLGPETEPQFLPLAPAAGPGRAAEDVARIETALASAAMVDAHGAILSHLAADARVMGSTAQPAIDPPAHRDEMNHRARTIEFRPLGGRASLAGDMVFTYGGALWRDADQPRKGHYARIWQLRANGWRLVFDELLAVPVKAQP